MLLKLELRRQIRHAAGYVALAAVALLLSLGAGNSADAVKTRPPLMLAAEQIILVERFAEPYTEQGYSVTPAGAVREWVKTRLQADGTPGIVRVILLDAQIKRQELKTKGGLRGWFSDDQKYRYDGRIHVRVEYQPAIPGQHASNAEAQASGYFTMPEDATLNQLDKQASALAQDLMRRTDMELENNMLRHMPGIVR
ncbi:MAG: hypothetical protein ABL951_01315 [Alphaproteobacteria bacterium]